MRISNTLFLGKVLQNFPELESTNKFAQEWLTSGDPPEGALVLADNQTAGRGQLDNRWESAPGENLLLSIILYPTFLPARRQFLLSQAVALGLSDLVGALLPGQEVRIKWPNDLYVGSEKTAGILIQNSLQGSMITQSIAGIGLNVNQTHFPAHLPQATSLARASGNRFDRGQALENLCSFLEQWYLTLRSGQWDLIESHYISRLYRWQQIHWYQKPGGQPFAGTIVGLTEAGKLMLDTADGIQTFGMKEIAFL